MLAQDVGLVDLLVGVKLGMDNYHLFRIKAVRKNDASLKYTNRSVVVRGYRWYWWLTRFACKVFVGRRVMLLRWMYRQFCERVLSWCVLLEHTPLCPIIFVVLLFSEACCCDASPQRLALAAHLCTGGTSQLASKRVECLARFGVSCALPCSGRRELSAVPGAMSSFRNGYGGVVKGLVEHHAPLETLLEPLQRHNLHPPTQSVLVLLARCRRCNEVCDGFGKIAMVLGSVAVDCLLYVSALFRCASSALFTLASCVRTIVKSSQTNL
jgi:hypothetical protein